MCVVFDKASLIEIDLQVMRQLLMLNDQVEEMKWQRRQQRKALFSSSCATPSIDETDCSDTERRFGRSTADSWSLRPSRGDDDDDEEEEATLKYPTPSALSLLRVTAGHEDRFSVSGSVDALDRSNPDTPDVFPVVLRRHVSPAAAPPKSSVRTSGERQEVGRGPPETTSTGQLSSTSDPDHNSTTSPPRTKEHDPHSTKNESFHDFCTYVEMLI